MVLHIFHAVLAAVLLGVIEGGRIGDDAFQELDTHRMRRGASSSGSSSDDDSSSSAQSKAADAIMNAQKDLSDSGGSQKSEEAAAVAPDPSAPDPLASRRDTKVAAPPTQTLEEPFEKSSLEKRAEEEEKKAADAVSHARQLAAQAAQVQMQAAVQLGEDLAKTKATAKNQMAAAVGKAATFVAEAARHGDPDKVMKSILDAYNDEMKSLEAEGPTYGLDPYATTHTTTPKPNKAPDPALKRSIELITRMAGVGEDGDAAKKDIMTQAAAIYRTAPSPVAAGGDAAAAAPAGGDAAAAAPPAGDAAAAGSVGTATSAATSTVASAAASQAASPAAVASDAIKAALSGSSAATSSSSVDLPASATQVIQLPPATASQTVVGSKEVKATEEATTTSAASLSL